MDRMNQLQYILDQLKLLPNQLTAVRLALIPVLWVLAWLEQPVLIGLGLLACFLTDGLDGYFARRMKLASDFGSQFDSLADHLLLPSGLVWMWMFFPQIYLENLALCLVTLLIYFSGLLLGMFKHRRFGNLHLVSSKISAVLVYLFLSYTFLAGEYLRWFFYLACGSFLLARLEGLLLQLFAAQVDAHTRSIFLIGRSR